ncbi:MAG: hypothetical protein KAI47_15735 [Deltaproteobacteria bacterium]|nr:hypothetical protein [Deltaproteobacteria bacterium]
MTTLLRTIYLKSEGQLNGGRPLYVVVRTVDEQSFLADTYGKLAKVVTASPRDADVLKVLLLWPEAKNEVTIEVPTDKAIGLYCLFTHPGNQWKVLFPSPMASNVHLRLVRGNVMVDRRSKRR